MESRVWLGPTSSFSPLQSDFCLVDSAETPPPEWVTRSGRPCPSQPASPRHQGHQGRRQPANIDWTPAGHQEFILKDRQGPCPRGAYSPQGDDRQWTRTQYRRGQTGRVGFEPGKMRRDLGTQLPHFPATFPKGGESVCYTTHVNRILHGGGPEPSIARKWKRNGRVFAEGESHWEFNKLGLGPDSVTDSVARGRSLHFSETRLLSAQMGVFGSFLAGSSEGCCQDFLITYR